MNLFELFGTITIKNEEANAALDTTIQKAEKLNETLGNTGGGTSTPSNTNTSTNTGTNKSGSTVVIPKGTNKTNAVEVALGNAMYDGIKKAGNWVRDSWNDGAEYYKTKELYTAQIEALTSNKEAAEYIVSTMEQFAIDTSLNLNESLDAAKYLLVGGMNPYDVPDMVERLGKITLGDSEAMKRNAYALMQSFNKQQFSAEEGRQYTNAGFPIYEYLSKATGISLDEIDRSVKDGQISHLDVAEAIRIATSPGERFYDTLDVHANTTEGREQKAQEIKDKAISELAGPFLEMERDYIKPKAMEFYDNLSEGLEANQESLKGLANFAGEQIANGNAATAGLFAGAALLANSHPIGAIASGVAGGTVWLKKRFEDWGILPENFVFGDKHKQMLSDTWQNPRFVNAGDAQNIATYKELMEQMEYLREHGEEAYRIKYGIDFPQPNETENEIMKWWDTIDPELKAELGVKEPPENATKEQFRAWWEDTRPEFVSYLRMGMPDKDATADEITEWFQSVNPSLISHMGISMPPAGATEAEILAWWASVRPTLMVQTSVIMPSVSNALNKGGSGGGINRPFTPVDFGAISGFATGLDYVPYDNYLARLHHGEAVLTRSEADIWRNGGDTGRMEALLTQMNGLLQSIAQNTGVDRAVMLDTGVMVGQLAPRMNVQLGEQSRRSARG